MVSALDAEKSKLLLITRLREKFNGNIGLLELNMTTNLLSASIDMRKSQQKAQCPQSFGKGRNKTQNSNESLQNI